MYVILTSKIGQFTTEAADGDGLKPLEAYDYLFFGSRKAHFVIAELVGDSKVKVTDETLPRTVNHVPSKFLPKFGTIEEARAELKKLTNFGHLETALVKI
jgi:hypothetical protein